MFGSITCLYGLVPSHYWQGHWSTDKVVVRVAYIIVVFVALLAQIIVVAVVCWDTMAPKVKAAVSVLKPVEKCKQSTLMFPGAKKQCLFARAIKMESSGAMGPAEVGIDSTLSAQPKQEATTQATDEETNTSATAAPTKKRSADKDLYNKVHYRCRLVGAEALGHLKSLEGDEQIAFMNEVIETKGKCIPAHTERTRKIVTEKSSLGVEGWKSFREAAAL